MIDTGYRFTRLIRRYERLRIGHLRLRLHAQIRVFGITAAPRQGRADRGVDPAGARPGRSLADRAGQAGGHRRVHAVLGVVTDGVEKCHHRLLGRLVIARDGQGAAVGRADGRPNVTRCSKKMVVNEHFPGKHLLRFVLDLGRRRSPACSSQARVLDHSRSRSPVPNRILTRVVPVTALPVRRGCGGSVAGSRRRCGDRMLAGR